MMRKIALLLVIVTFASTTSALPGTQGQDSRWNETRSIDGLPFCAFVLRVIYDASEGERTVYVLMEPRAANENNLYLMFRALSERFPGDPSLKVWAYTDVEQCAFLATGTMMTSSPAEGVPDTSALGRASKRVLQLARYKRTKSVELFRYNPDYPKPGERTVLIRGKED